MAQARQLSRELTRESPTGSPEATLLERDRIRMPAPTVQGHARRRAPVVPDDIGMITARSREFTSSPQRRVRRIDQAAVVAQAVVAVARRAAAGRRDRRSARAAPAACAGAIDSEVATMQPTMIGEAEPRSLPSAIASASVRPPVLSSLMLTASYRPRARRARRDRARSRRRRPGSAAAIARQRLVIGRPAAAARPA